MGCITSCCGRLLNCLVGLQAVSSVRGSHDLAVIHASIICMYGSVAASSSGHPDIMQHTAVSRGVPYQRALTKGNMHTCSGHQTVTEFTQPDVSKLAWRCGGSLHTAPHTSSCQLVHSPQKYHDAQASQQQQAQTKGPTQQHNCQQSTPQVGPYGC